MLLAMIVSELRATLKRKCQSFRDGSAGNERGFNSGRQLIDGFNGRKIRSVD
jgi:hypothetical protein